MAITLNNCLNPTKIISKLCGTRDTPEVMPKLASRKPNQFKLDGLSSFSDFCATVCDVRI